MLNIANTCLIVINYSTIFSSQRECCCIHRLYHAISCHGMLFCMLEVSIQTPKVKPGWPHKWLSWVWVQIGGSICFHLGFYNSNLKWNPQRKPFQTSCVKIHQVRKRVLIMGYVHLLGMDPGCWVYLGFTWGLQYIFPFQNNRNTISDPWKAVKCLEKNEHSQHGFGL